MRPLKDFKVAGSFEIVSGKMRISDPGYKKRSRHSKIILDNVNKGSWSAYIVKSDTFLDPNILYVAEILALAEDCEPGSSLLAWNLIPFTLSVDFGCAGMFDERYFRVDALVNDEELDEKWRKANRHKSDGPGSDWFAMCCNLLNKELCGIIPFGFIARSGKGDGGYPAFLAKNSKSHKIAGVRIVFLGN